MKMLWFEAKFDLCQLFNLDNLLEFSEPQTPIDHRRERQNHLQ